MDAKALGEDKVAAAEAADAVFRGDILEGKAIRECVGYNHEIWREYLQPTGLAAKWNTNCLFVRAYLDHTAAVEEEEEEVPGGLGLDVIQTPRNLIDFHDICLSISAKWRQNPFAPAFFRAVRILEREISASVAEQCPAPDHPNTSMVIDICSVLSYLWAQQYILERVLPRDVGEAPVFKEKEAQLELWTREQHRRALQAKVTMKRQLLGAAVFPGELELYARHNGGIFASDLATAIEDTRPYIAHKALLEACDELDLDLGCGVLVMHLFSRYLNAHMKFPWARLNVFLDTEFMANTRHEHFRFRVHPWILLVGNQWHIMGKGAAWRTASPYRAICVWYGLLQMQAQDDADDEDNVPMRFYDGWDSWDLSELTFPPIP
jgi:hypothetical protein